MKVLKGDLWCWYYEKKATVVISTNGFVKENGECVMGRGVALQAKQRFPWIAKTLGEDILKDGNHVFYLGKNLISFPVKHDWWEKADLKLVERSAGELEALVRCLEIEPPIVLPKVGCHNGKLEWKDVEPILNKYLDERFLVVDHE